jgi:hypothetical protein
MFYLDFYVPFLELQYSMYYLPENLYRKYFNLVGDGDLQYSWGWGGGELRGMGHKYESV